MALREVGINLNGLAAPHYASIRNDPRSGWSEIPDRDFHGYVSVLMSPDVCCQRTL